jgi:limonene-1,2-epoxide hydrolase
MTQSAHRRTEEEERNLETVRRWIDAYNTDVERMVREFYAPDLVVRTMGAGTYTGTEHFLDIELAVLKAAPKRRVRIDHLHAVGNVVVAELVLLNPDMGEDWQLPLAAVLEFENGKIKRDRSYHNIGADFPLWPGL